MSGTPELINRYVYLSLVAIGGASSRTPSPQFDPIYRQRDVSVGTIARAVHCAVIVSIGELNSLGHHPADTAAADATRMNLHFDLDVAAQRPHDVEQALQ